MKLLQSVILAALMSVPTMAYAEVKGWDSGVEKNAVSMRDLIPKLSDEEEYSDRYTFDAEFDQGGRIAIELTVSNLGWGDHHGAAVVRATWPNGKKYVYAEEFDADEWSYAKNRFQITIGAVSVEGRGKDTFVVKHSGKNPFELTFKNKIPMWRPGHGAIDIDDQRFALVLIAPRADVTGRAKIGGTWVDLKSAGKASGDYNFTTFAPFDLATRFSRFQDFNGDVFVAWRSIKLTKAHGGRSLTWVVVGYKDKIVFSDATARFRTGNVIQDKQSGYAVPRAIQVEGRRGKDSIKLVMKGSHFKSEDMLKDYGTAIKLVARAVTKPVQITVDGDYTLQMTIQGATATVKGKRGYSMDYMN